MLWYDIFHNDDNQLVVIMPYLETAPILKYNQNTFELYSCPHNHTFIYTLPLLNYEKKIQIEVNGSSVDATVNKYPVFKDELLFSTIVKDEDEFILPWIDFHLRLGIQRFIVYDNSEHDTLPSLLQPYIENGTVLLLKWPYPYRLSLSGLSGQTTQQNHSIYAFKTSRLIGLFDVDEYVNLQKGTNLKLFFEPLGNPSTSSFKLLNKFFYNPDNLPVSNRQFLNIFNCDRITYGGHEKCFVVPKNVITYSVHLVTLGGPLCEINPADLFFNHYCYLNKSHRGRNNTPFKDDSILRLLS